jgi:hypothetical protein
LPGSNSELEPPDPIPNSEVKQLSADDSVGLPHVKVGHCQASNTKPLPDSGRGFFFVISDYFCKHRVSRIRLFGMIAVFKLSLLDIEIPIPISSSKTKKISERIYQ